MAARPTPGGTPQGEWGPGGCTAAGGTALPPTTMEQRLLQPWLLSTCRSPICVSPTPLGGL